MRKILHRIQDLGQKAEQLKAAAAAIPARAAELRETVLMSGAQLRQLRTEVQSSVAALRTDSDDRITRALGELNDSAPAFREAGYELDGVDLELGPAQRLIVHLDKCAEVDPRRLRALLQSCGDKPTTRAVLAACLKADETAGQVQLSHLDFCELIVHAGPVPTVRLCWRAPAAVAEVGPHRYPPPRLPRLHRRRSHPAAGSARNPSSNLAGHRVRRNRKRPRLHLPLKRVLPNQAWQRL
jgi:hypothetical protein